MKFKLLVNLVCACAISSIAIYAQQADTTISIRLEEVTVSSFRVKSDMKNLPQNIQVLNKKDIKGIPNESIGDLLKKTSGVDIIEYPGFSSSIGMRGFVPTSSGNTYTLMLINGIPSGTQNPSTIDIFNADQVEILKGPYSAFFGSGAMAGVINIVTPLSKDSIHGNVGLSVGCFGTYGIKASTGGRITHKLNFDVSAKLLRQSMNYKTGSNNILGLTVTEKQIMDDKSYSKVFENTKYDKYCFGLRVGYDFNKNWQVNLYENVFLARHVLTHGNFWGTYGSSEKDIQRWSQSLTVDGKVGINIIKFSPYFSNEDVNYYNNISNTNFITTNYNYKTYGFVFQDAISFGSHSLIVGIDNYSQKFANKRWSNRQTSSAPSQPDYANIARGAFMQVRFRLLNNKLNAALGARYDFLYFKVFETELIKSGNSTETYHTLNPNIGLKYEFLPGLNVNASAGTAFLAPDAFKKTGYYYSYSKVYKGNPNLTPEKSFSHDFGLSYTNQNKGITLGITYFDNSHKGLIMYDRSNKDTTTYKNATKARMSGIELSLAYDLGNMLGYKYSLKVYSNLTHMLKSEVTIDTVTSDMKYVRNNNASFGVEYNNRTDIIVRLNARYIGNRFEDNWLYKYDAALKTNVPLQTSNGQDIRPSLVNEMVLEHPAFLVFDLSGSYTLAQKYTIGLAIQNLFDENYAEKDGYYMPGRMITVSFNYSF
jgi:outer membrane cobalamin receptor